ncbi:MAG: hypothetical protein FWC26_00915 [Fibromonadales bacterium]|nr:hypothetical protein [Fibromonadales bacterium]
MKYLIFLLIVTASLCLANTTQNKVDSLSMDVKILQTTQREIKSSIDSLSGKFSSDNFISINAMKETQELHNKAFDKMQCSFDRFVNKVIIIITLIGLFMGGLVFVNFKSGDKIKDDVKNELMKIKDFEHKLKESECKVDELRKNLDILFSIQGRSHCELAKSYLGNKNYSDHSIEIRNFYQCLLKINNLRNCDYENLQYAHSLLKEYEKYKNEPDFKASINNLVLDSLSKFIEYCKGTKKDRHLELAEKILNELKEITKG